MFGTIAVPAPRIDLDGESLARCIIIVAIAERDSRNEHRARAIEYRFRGDFAASNVHTMLADQAHTMMLGATAPLRVEIQCRTSREKIQAAWRVATDRAEFCRPACGDETCDECERPLWHHILLSDSRWLCPFGRQFWVLARALVDDGNCFAKGYTHDTLAEIARQS